MLLKGKNIIMKVSIVNSNLSQKNINKKQTFSGYNITTQLLKGEKTNDFFEELINKSKSLIEELGKKYDVNLKFIQGINLKDKTYEHKVQLAISENSKNSSNKMFRAEQNLFGLIWLRSFGEDNITINPWLKEQENNYLVFKQQQKSK